MNGSLGAPGHTSSPIVWMEGETNSYIGGCDDTLVWCKSFVNVGEAPLPAVVPNIDEFNPNHGFDYDLDQSMDVAAVDEIDMQEFYAR